MSSKGKSIGSTICDFSSRETEMERFVRFVKEELESGQRIRFKLDPHGYQDRITHWHLRHISSDVLFIILGETGL